MKDEKDLTVIQKRAIASAKAKTRLVKLHYEDYERLYREECKRFGLSNRYTRAERIKRLRKEIERINNNQEEDTW